VLDRNRVLWNFDDYFRGGLLETKSAAGLGIFSVFLYLYVIYLFSFQVKVKLSTRRHVRERSVQNQ